MLLQVVVVTVYNVSQYYNGTDFQIKSINDVLSVLLCCYCRFVVGIDVDVNRIITINNEIENKSE